MSPSAGGLIQKWWVYLSGWAVRSLRKRMMKSTREASWSRASARALMRVVWSWRVVSEGRTSMKKKLLVA